MNDTIVFFNSPADIQAKNVQPGTRIRLGGLVKEGSRAARRRPAASPSRSSTRKRAIQVRYKGLLPDLFREGQGVVTEGVLETAGVFRADTVLAKHDENYMPREVADALKKQGHWQGEANAAPKTQ